MPLGTNRFLFLVTLSAVVLLTPVYYLVGRFAASGLTFVGSFKSTAIAGVFTIVGYNCFFIVQGLSSGKKVIVVESSLDQHIPFFPKWIWVYSVLYYMLIFIPISLFTDLDQTLRFLSGGVLILTVCLPIFLVWPTRCPAQWRDFEAVDLSTRVLKTIQHFDRGRSCFPSLHCALASYTAGIVPSLWLTMSIPIIVALSCLFVKQHSIVDLPISIIFGLAVGFAFRNII